MIKGKHIAITGILAFYKRKDAFDERSIDCHHRCRIDHRTNYSYTILLDSLLLISYHKKDTLPKILENQGVQFNEKSPLCLLWRVSQKSPSDISSHCSNSQVSFGIHYM